jgi:hypothetical protein
LIETVSQNKSFLLFNFFSWAFVTMFWFCFLFFLNY